ncbi:MAG TPA: hypothetical protein VFM36_02690 [Thermoanaerobaculia bacterium]|nr:hypothetical protein [Thermoanaerobaculia bacterium]
MIGLLITIIGFSVVGAAMQRLLGGGAPFLLGVGTVGLTLYVTLLLHIPMIPVLILLFVIALLIVGDQWRAGDLARHIPRTRPTSATIVTAIPILALMFAAAVLPLADFDGRAFWVLKAKAIATERLVDGPFFQGQSSWNPKNEYPLLVPIANAAVMTASGSIDDLTIRWLPILALGSLVFHARKWVGVWVAALVPWIPQFAGSPEGSALTGYNDILLGAFAACAFFELVERASPLRFGFWLAFLLLTKNEGLPFALILLAAGIVVWRERIIRALIPLLVAMITLLVWRGRVDATDDDPLLSLLPTLPERLDRFVPAVVGLLRHAFELDRWGLFWIAVFAAATFLVVRREWKTVALPASIIGAMSVVYVAAYMVTVWQLEDHMEASADRLLMHFVGPATFLIGALARSRYSPAPHPQTEASREPGRRDRDSPRP